MNSAAATRPLPRQGVNVLGLSTAEIFLICTLGHSYHAFAYLLSTAAPANAAGLFICSLAQVLAGSELPEGVVLDYERTVARQRDRYTALTTPMADAVVLCDANGCVVELNPALAVLLGRLAEQIIDDPLSALLAEPARADALLNALHTPVHGLDLRAADGSYIAMRWNAEVIEAERGVREQLVDVGHDMRAARRNRAPRGQGRQPDGQPESGA